MELFFYFESAINYLKSFYFVVKIHIKKNKQNYAVWKHAFNIVKHIAFKSCAIECIFQVCNAKIKELKGSIKIDDGLVGVMQLLKCIHSS